MLARQGHAQQSATVRESSSFFSLNNSTTSAINAQHYSPYNRSIYDLGSAENQAISGSHVDSVFSKAISGRHNFEPSLHYKTNHDARPYTAPHPGAGSRLPIAVLSLLMQQVGLLEEGLSGMSQAFQYRQRRSRLRYNKHKSS